MYVVMYVCMYVCTCVSACVCECMYVRVFVLLSPLQEGDTWFLIEIRWWRKFRSHIHFGLPEEDTTPPSTEFPGPVDNKPLVRLDSAVKLRSSMFESMDFSVQSSSVWTLLMQWYGGGPAIPRKAIINSSRRVQVELHPLFLKVAQVDDLDKKEEMCFSKANLVKDVKQAICKRFGINTEKEDTQLWHFFVSSPYKVLNEEKVKSSKYPRVVL